jgi:hypothetical protein
MMYPTILQKSQFDFFLYFNRYKNDKIVDLSIVISNLQKNSHLIIFV